MSEIAEIVDSLENKLQKLFAKTDNLEQNILELKQDLANATKTILLKSQENADLSKKYDALKITNSLLGSDENKRDTKLKINSLVREIDYCIAQLSD
jgi:regulator of replication initiation timing